MGQESAGEYSGTFEKGDFSDKWYVVLAVCSHNDTVLVCQSSSDGIWIGHVQYDPHKSHSLSPHERSQITWEIDSPVDFLCKYKRSKRSGLCWRTCGCDAAKLKQCVSCKRCRGITFSVWTSINVAHWSEPEHQSETGKPAIICQCPNNSKSKSGLDLQKNL